MTAIRYVVEEDNGVYCIRKSFSRRLISGRSEDVDDTIKALERIIADHKARGNETVRLTKRFFKVYQK